MNAEAVTLTIHDLKARIEQLERNEAALKATIAELQAVALGKPVQSTYQVGAKSLLRVAS